ncbi:MAG TPA: signal peptidase I [Clostridia bacterium]
MSEPAITTPAASPQASMTAEQVMGEILDWLKYIVTALAVGLLLVTFVVQNNKVIGSSMEPTLLQDDQLLVQKVSARLGAFHYGDIITIDGVRLMGAGEPDLVKRVVGLSGDTIDIRGGRLYRNGIPVDEKYLPAGVQTFPLERGFDHVVLGPDEIFVMGDNRGNSKDSRVFGPVPVDYVIGTCMIRFYPFSRVGLP